MRRISIRIRETKPREAALLAPAVPKSAEAIELEMVQSACDHWFTQGGEAQFGPLSACLNTDELIASILHVVRAASAWQPMESFPEDGQVIVCWADQKFDTIGRAEYLEIR